MSDSKKIRRVALLCLYCIGNIACYRAGWNEKKQLRINEDFWTKVNGNFLDTATLDWCKLFCESDGKHHWSTIFSNKTTFRKGLFVALNLTEQEFKLGLQKIKDYRNKYLAHLDEPTTLFYPDTEIMLKSCMYLYHLLATEAHTRKSLTDAVTDAEGFYDDYFEETIKQINHALILKKAN